SESNILSVAFNQKITHHFLYGKKDVEANVYQARRTQADIAYRVGAEQITARKVQMEIDQTFEYGAVVTIIEAKNGFPRDFAVYQLHHPCLFFTNQKTRFGIQSVQCCYLLREKQEQQSILRLYLYKFADPKDMTSIALAKSAEYRLQKK
ncbi:MAG: hypothetical protein MPL62_16460, partial [Alphaproteobacteria bacterium]|nr:hypothetical protein [Alphaproteobacteria bacterium]